MRKDLIALVLAAGKSTRFKSERSKLLHPILGKPLLQFSLDCVFQLRPRNVHVVVGYQKDEIMKQPLGKNVGFVVQEKQMGTAHAVLAAEKTLKKELENDVLILNGDLFFLREKTLESTLKLHKKANNSLTFLSAEMEKPGGFGRVIRTENGGFRIVEERDALPAERRVKEVNVGVYFFKIKHLLEALPEIKNENKKGEYYLTDIIEIMSCKGRKVDVFRIPHTEEIIGINDRSELARAAELLRKRKIKELSKKGVTCLDPATTWIDFDVKIGMDTTVHSSVIIEGKSVIGKGCMLYPFVHICDSRIGNKVWVLTSTVIEGSILEEGARVGPFCHLRPDTLIKSGAKVGNFVEMKNTVFGRGSKAGHLSYLGDTEVKENVNIGAGTITCNYDGRKKHKTVIENGAFIGSGTELVAPLKVGKGAYVGAGSTITKDVSPHALAVSRKKQIERPGWAKKKIKK